MLNAEEKREVKSIVHSALEKAERIWGRHGLSLDEALHARADSAGIAKRERVPARIPGHNTVEEGQERVGTFIALVADIRESSNHLMSRIAAAKATELERVFYETSALLPALERTIQFENGAVTEYLGDGVLALFSVDERDRQRTVKAAYAAAENCLGDTRHIVNEALNDRYDLPPLNLGIGMAMSKAVVSLVGIEGNSHAKVIGRCVYYATKLSSGKNEIVVDDGMDAAWPVSENGTLRFKKQTRRGVEGYLVTRSSEG